jgi:glycosyltransferase involved in cell wall biosynthesis
MKTTVVMPTYNEADNLVQIVAELMTLDLQGLDILIIDDNSPDGTGQLADELAAQYARRVHVIHRQGKMGLGTAYITGFRNALNSGADYIVQMDADFSHSPSYLPMFLEKMAECDLVIGSRYVPGGSVDERWSPWRRFLSWSGMLTRAPLPVCQSMTPPVASDASVGRHSSNLTLIVSSPKGTPSKSRSPTRARRAAFVSAKCPSTSRIDPWASPR